MYYHLSDIKKFMRCERLYFLSKDVNNAFKPYLRFDDSLNDLLVSYFDIDKYFLGVRNDTTERVLNSLNEYDWFIHPRFNDGDLRINIPLMHKNKDKYDLYFINYGIQIKELDLINYRTCVQILKKYGLKTNKIFIISFNGEYISDGNINSKELFIVSDKYKDSKIISIVKQEKFDYEGIIKKIEKCDFNNTEAKKCKYCRQNGICDYYYECFKQEEKDVSDCILTLVSSANKNKMYEAGIHRLKDVDINQLEGNRVQYAQIMASMNNGLFVDKLALRDFLNKLSDRPISFIDFEWDRYLVPPYKNMKPLDVLCFEYALYYLDEQGHIEHRTFVGTQDCRKDFIESLINDLPKQGPILAYNADGAEELRLKELGMMFPEYKDELDVIVSRFIDLATPFTEGLIYDVRMEGNYTLKKLVDICSDYSYKDLDIYDGMEAVYNWRDIDKDIANDSEHIIDDLKQYCSLDAYGLFLVYKWLVELIIES